MWTVTAVSLGALVNLVLNRRSEGVLRPVLLLTGEDPFIEELCVLARVECVVADALAVVGSWSLTWPSRLAVLRAGLVRHAVVVCHVVDRLELLHLIDRIIIHVIIVVAHRIAFIEIVLGKAWPVLSVVRSSSGYVVDGHAVGACAFLVETGARGGQAEGQSFVEVAS